MKAVLPKSNRIAPANGNGHENPASVVIIPKLRIQTVTLKITGKTPLIVHAWSKKAITMMLNKQMSVASAGREKKNPLNDFRESLYNITEGEKHKLVGFGVPSPAFKAAIVSSANDVSMKMTEIKRGLHVSHYTTEIIAPPLPKVDYTEWDIKHAKELEFEHSKGCSMRQDLVRLQTGVADVRFRGCWPKWGCTLEIEYNESVLSLEQVVNLVSAAGYGCGIGEWRPSAPECRSGEYGRFEVVQD